MNNPHQVVGIIRLVSTEPLTVKPDFASIGGFDVTTPDGVEVIFDWEKSEGSVFTTYGDRIGIEWELSNFDSEFFEGSNDHTSDPNWVEILKGVINEIHYETGMYDEPTNKETPIQMVVESFAIGEIPEDDSDTVWQHFSKEQIAAHNERMNKEFNDGIGPSTEPVVQI